MCTICTYILRRKSRARKNRQTRKSTQPVPADIMDQINKHDRKEDAKGEGAEVEDTDGTTSEEATPPRNRRRGKEDTPTTTTPASSSNITVTTTKAPVMSSYRPTARPTSQILQGTGGGPSGWPPGKGAGDTEQKMKAELKDTLIKSANCKASVLMFTCVLHVFAMFLTPCNVVSIYKVLHCQQIYLTRLISNQCSLHSTYSVIFATLDQCSS